MKVLCKRNGIYVVKAGKTVELEIGEIDLDKEQAESLIKRKLLSAVEVEEKKAAAKTDAK
tara:strand:- start:1172 stop:1351 length:180 start_codon:yes stop_codon:yes gene_type:complete